MMIILKVHNAYKLILKIHQAIIESCASNWLVKIFQMSKNINYPISHFQTDHIYRRFWDTYAIFVFNNIVSFCENAKCSNNIFARLKKLNLEPFIEDPKTGDTRVISKTLIN